MRSITVLTVDAPAEPSGDLEIDLDEAFLARLSSRFTLVGKAGVMRYTADNVVPRAGVGAAWDFGGGLYIDGSSVFGWASVISEVENETALALNYETDRLYTALRAVLRYRQGAFSSINTLMGRWTWPGGWEVQGLYGFAWERGVGFGNSLWVEGKAPLLPFLEPRLGGTLSRETNGDLSASIRVGVDLTPWPDVKILLIAEPFLLDYAGAFRQTISVDVSFR